MAETIKAIYERSTTRYANPRLPPAVCEIIARSGERPDAAPADGQGQAPTHVS